MSLECLLTAAIFASGPPLAVLPDPCSDGSGDWHLCVDYSQPLTAQCNPITGGPTGPVEHLASGLIRYSDPTHPPFDLFMELKPKMLRISRPFVEAADVIERFNDPDQVGRPVQYVLKEGWVFGRYRRPDGLVAPTNGAPWKLPFLRPDGPGGAWPAGQGNDEQLTRWKEYVTSKLDEACPLPPGAGPDDPGICRYDLEWEVWNEPNREKRYRAPGVCPDGSQPIGDEDFPCPDDTCERCDADLVCACPADGSPGPSREVMPFADPDGAGGMAGEQDRWFEVYRVAEQLIHRRAPDARVGGLGISTNDPHDEDGIWARSVRVMHDFVQYCVDHDCRIDFLTWHELTGSRFGEISDHIREVRAMLERDFPEFPPPKLYVNEYIAKGNQKASIRKPFNSMQYSPGFAVHNLYQLEKGDVDGAAKSCWEGLAVCPDGTSSTPCPNRTCRECIDDLPCACPADGSPGPEFQGPEQCFDRDLASTPPAPRGTGHLNGLLTPPVGGPTGDPADYGKRANWHAHERYARMNGAWLCSEKNLAADPLPDNPHIDQSNLTTLVSRDTHRTQLLVGYTTPGKHPGSPETDSIDLVLRLRELPARPLPVVIQKVPYRQKTLERPGDLEDLAESAVELTTVFEGVTVAESPLHVEIAELAPEQAAYVEIQLAPDCPIVDSCGPSCEPDLDACTVVEETGSQYCVDTTFGTDETCPAELTFRRLSCDCVPVAAGEPRCPASGTVLTCR